MEFAAVFSPQRGFRTSVIDSEGSVLGHAEYDLMRAHIALPGPCPEFLRGYETALAAEEDQGKRAAYYRLSRGLRGLNYFAGKDALGPGDEDSAQELRIMSRPLARLSG